MNSHIVAGVLPNITTQLHRISVYFVFSRLNSEGMMAKDEIWSTARLLCEGLITINKDLISWRICRLFSWQPLYVRNMSLKINCRISNLLSRINTHTEIASYRGYLAPIVWFNKTLEVSQSAVQKLVGTYLTASTSLFLYSSE